jgi:hypothetical protein
MEVIRCVLVILNKGGGHTFLQLQGLLQACFQLALLLTLILNGGLDGCLESLYWSPPGDWKTWPQVKESQASKQQVVDQPRPASLALKIELIQPSPVSLSHRDPRSKVGIVSRAGAMSTRKLGSL